MTFQDYYLQSLEADPNNAACLHQYGNFLSERGFDRDAEKFFVRSSENTKGYKTYEWNYWGSPRLDVGLSSSPMIHKTMKKDIPKLM